MTLGTRRRLWASRRPAAVDHGGRAAVVDLEGVVAGTGEQPVVADQPLRRGPGVAVDRLVVVAHPEDGQIGAGQQPDQQQVGGSEVLELVDQQQPARPLGGAAGVGLGQEHLDGAHDLLVEVQLVAGGQAGPVALDHVGEAVDVALAVRPRPRRGRAGRGGRPTAPPTRGPGGRCWPGVGCGAGRRSRRGRVAPAARPGSCGGGRTGAGTAAVRRGWPGPRALSVRIWRPCRSGVRSSISSAARLLNATRQVASAGARQEVSSSRARSVSTRVLPEPAGAMMRAAPPGWVTAARWSAARPSTAPSGAATPVPARAGRWPPESATAGDGGSDGGPNGSSRPRSRAMRCSTGGSKQVGGPPSHHTVEPSAATTSPSAPARRRRRPDLERRLGPGPCRQLGPAAVDRVGPDQMMQHLGVSQVGGRDRPDRGVQRSARGRLVGVREGRVGRHLEHHPLPGVPAGPQGGDEAGRVVARRSQVDPQGIGPGRGGRPARCHHEVAAQPVGPGEVVG